LKVLEEKRKSSETKKKEKFEESLNRAVRKLKRKRDDVFNIYYNDQSDSDQEVKPDLEKEGMIVKLVIRYQLVNIRSGQIKRPRK
jgi:hypothetical protein